MDDDLPLDPWGHELASGWDADALTFYIMLLYLRPKNETIYILLCKSTKAILIYGILRINARATPRCMK